MTKPTRERTAPQRAEGKATDGSNYVGVAGGGGYIAVVNGVPVGGGPFPTQAAAEQAYNANGGPTGPSGGGGASAPVAGGQTYNTVHAGALTLDQMLAGLDGAAGGHWNGNRNDPNAVLAGFNGSWSPPGGAGAYGAGAYGADPNGTMYFNQGAGQLAYEQAALAAQTAYQQALIKGQTDQNANAVAQQAWLQAFQTAQLTGVYGGSSTLDAQRLQEQKLLDAQNYGLSQGNLMGTYNGAPTLAGQLQAAQLSGMYNGSPTMAMQAQNNQEALGYLGLMKGMSGPANAFDYAHALTGTPGGLADIVRAAGGAYQMPAFGGGGDQYVAPLSLQSIIQDVGQYSPTAGGAAYGQQQAMAPPAYGQGPAVAGPGAGAYSQGPAYAVPPAAPVAQPTPPGYGGGLGDPGLPAGMGGSGSPPAAPSAPAPGMPARGPMGSIGQGPVYANPPPTSNPRLPTRGTGDVYGTLGTQVAPMFGTSSGLGGAPPAMAHDPLGPPLPPAQPPHMPYDPTFNGGGGLPPARPPYVAHDPLGPGLPPSQPPHMPYDPTFNGGRAAPPGAYGQGPAFANPPASGSYGQGPAYANPPTAAPPTSAAPSGDVYGRLGATTAPTTTAPSAGGYIPSYGKLPPPNQIAPQAWNAMTPSQQQLLIGAYGQGANGQVPYLPQDVMALYNQSLKGYSGPMSATVGF